MAAYVAKNEKTALPKSYEDTQVSQTQRITHDSILALGHHLFEKTTQDEHEAFERYLQSTKHDLLQKCETEKKALLLETLEAADAKMKKAMEDAKKAQDKAVRAEAKRVEASMKKIASQQVEEESMAGDERQEEALKKARIAFDEEKQIAIGETRKEEQEQKRKEIIQVNKQNDAKIKKLREEWELEKQKSLKELRAAMEKEKDVALSNLRKQIEKKKENHMFEIKKEHLKDIDELNQKMEKQKLQNDNLRSEMLDQEARCAKTETNLKEVMESFQSFVNTVPGFAEGQADFVLNGLLPLDN